MAEFKIINSKMMVAEQIGLADLREAKKQGVSIVINNRPDGEEPEAPQDAEMKAEAERMGLNYLYLPVGHSGMSSGQIDAMQDAVATAEGRVLAYCRSGTRSTMLWALSQAKAGIHPDDITRMAASAGYNVGPIRAMMDMLAAQSSK